MTNSLLMVLLCVVSLSVTAAEKETAKNYCHDPADKKEFDALLRKYPTDTGIIRLFAMRQGLCEMINKQQISLETGIDLWAIERQKILMERTKKELNRLTKKTL
ncbi:MAG: hypothetical protein PHR16_10510 [Methylovulum sp.]|nr:hypothetical protein [Methylovulum sp.]